MVDLTGMLHEVRNLEGDYAECGVWRGDSAALIHAGLPPEGTLWLFDSFAGHAEPGQFDDASAHPKGRYADTTEKLIRERCPNALIVMGYIPNTFKMFVGHEHKFRFVNVDVDHYEPTKAACEFFLPRMVKGGIMRFDDYLHRECPGATKAINEIIGEQNLTAGDWRYVNA